MDTNTLIPKKVYKSNLLFTLQHTDCFIKSNDFFCSHYAQSLQVLFRGQHKSWNEQKTPLFALATCMVSGQIKGIAICNWSYLDCLIVRITQCGNVLKNCIVNPVYQVQIRSVYSRFSMSIE